MRQMLIIETIGNVYFDILNLRRGRVFATKSKIVFIVLQFRKVGYKDN